MAQSLRVPGSSTQFQGPLVGEHEATLDPPSDTPYVVNLKIKGPTERQQVFIEDPTA